MTLKVSQQIRQRLAAIIDDLKSAIEQEAAKAYLTSIIIVESLILESEVELCDDSWMEYINEDCMTDVSDLSYLMPCSSQGKFEESLQMTNSQIEADSCCSALPPQVASHLSLEKDTSATLCESCREPRKHYKRRTSNYNTLNMIVQNLPRRNLLHCLETY